MYTCMLLESNETKFQVILVYANTWTRQPTVAESQLSADHSSIFGAPNIATYRMESIQCTEFNNSFAHSWTYSS